MKLLPDSATRDATLLLWSRGLRAFGDGFMSLVLPVYLLARGFNAFEVGILMTTTLLGSAALTLLVGLIAVRIHRRTLMMAMAGLMVATGLGFAVANGFWALLLVAFLGTLNPSAGDVSAMLPLEYAALSEAVADRDRTAIFARYSLVGSLVGAFGTLAAGAADTLGGPAAASTTGPAASILGLQIMFVGYAAIGLVALLIYRALSAGLDHTTSRVAAPLGRSRAVVFKLAALFSVDSFAGGLVVQSLLAVWLFDRFALSLTAAANIFFWVNVLAAFSYLAAVPIARRFGLVNTMVFTHLPANLCLVAVPFAPDLGVAVVLLLIRGLLSQMDVPTRTSYVMAVVTPPERAAAASITALPRSLAAAASPSLAGWLLTGTGFGWPLAIGGGLKIAYDLTLLALFRRVRPPEEQEKTPPPSGNDAGR